MKKEMEEEMGRVDVLGEESIDSKIDEALLESEKGSAVGNPPNSIT